MSDVVLNTDKNFGDVLEAPHGKLLELIPELSERLTWLPTRLLFNLCGSLELRGFENIEKIGTNAIIASNHSNEADPIIITACMPFFSSHLPLFFVSREKKFYGDMGWKKIIYGGTLFKMWGAYQVYEGLRDYKKSLRNHITLLRHGRNVLIFPTGKRNIQGEHPKGKGGVSFLALETGLPIVPVLIEGVERMTFRDLIFGKRKIRVTFGKPLYAQDIFKDAEHATITDERNDYEDASTVILDKIADLSGL
jgi:1-acyl-sn-glycerol-3-phosphate acyltransferase